MKLFRRVTFLFVLLILTVPNLGITPVAAFQSGTEPKTPIKHFIVVMQQNHTFDNYFGTYPGANGIPQGVCLPSSLSNPGSGCVKPFKITDHPMSDLGHSDTTFADQFQSGKMNGFVDALNQLNQDGTLSMGYFDGSDIPFYWNLADQYVLFDNYFSSAHTGSIANRLFWVAGQPGDKSNRIPKNGFNNITTIFDRLEARGISWKFYIKDYDPNMNYRTLPNLDYLPPQIQWVPLLSMDRFLDDPKLSSHIVDLNEYYSDLEKGTLPAVSYVLLLGASEHPMSDLSLGEQATRTMIYSLMQSNAWQSSAFFITYDDWGGWYDHVPPPQIDDRGLGFRVPAMLVSPYARTGFVDHTQLEHTSILKFIEDNWNIPPLAARDENANNLTSAFDFTMTPRPPVFISATREVPQPRIEPRRIVIYAAYGAAILFAGLILVRALSSKEKLPHSSYAARNSEESKP